MIIPFFLPHQGCPHRCLFCNQAVSSGGEAGEWTEGPFRRRVEESLSRRAAAGGRPGRVQIAFYGGNFTGLPRGRRAELLRWAGAYLGGRGVDSLRVSTRPDHLGGDVLDELGAGGVATVEVGLQSLDDGVLARCRRGHTAAEGEEAVPLLKGRGFETSVHLMPGLPGDSPAVFAETVRRTVALRPGGVRIHPTLVLRGAALEEDFRAGRYRPLELGEAVEWCARAVRRFAEAGIPVIRLGLQPTPGMTGGDDVVAGPFDPAFGSLVRESLFLRAAAALLDGSASGRREARFRVAPGDVSFLRGRRNANLSLLLERFSLESIAVAVDESQARGTLVLEANPERISVDCLDRS